MPKSSVKQVDPSMCALTPWQKRVQFPLDELDVLIAQERTAEAIRRRSDPNERALWRATFEAVKPALRPGLCGMRIILGRAENGHPLPPDWFVPIEEGEVPIITTPLPAPHVGFASLVARIDELPSPTVSEAERERIADSLVEAVLREVR